MTETTVPTMNFRWLVPHMAAYAADSSCARLQQAHYVGGQLVWRNVPIVAVQSAPEPPLPSLVEADGKG